MPPAATTAIARTSPRQDVSSAEDRRWGSARTAGSVASVVPPGSGSPSASGSSIASASTTRPLLIDRQSTHPFGAATTVGPIQVEHFGHERTGFIRRPADRVGRLRQGARSRPPGDPRAGREGRHDALLPAPHLAGRARGPDGGPRDGDAGLQQLPRADRRPAGQGSGARRPRHLRHGADGIAPAERHDPAPHRARGGARRLDGDRGGTRLHDRLPGERRLHRHDPRARRHGDLRLGRPCVDPRRLPAIGCEAAAVPPQPDRQARTDARAGGGRRRWRPGRRRRRLLDGGRHRSPDRDRRALSTATAPA